LQEPARRQWVVTATAMAVAMAVVMEAARIVVRAHASGHAKLVVRVVVGTAATPDVLETVATTHTISRA